MIEVALSTPTSGDLDAMYALESASYPEDEAATREGMAFRLRVAAPCFLIARARDEEDIIGFVNGTRTMSAKLTHESMSAHEEQGKTLCVHSVVVKEARRRRGFGLAMMREYCERVCVDESITEMRLLCKEYLVGFYSAAGFELVGKSDVVHGKDTWMEMRMDADAARRRGGA